MNNRFLILLACMSSVGALQSHAPENPFSPVRQVIQEFDQLFAELEQAHKQHQGHLSLSYTYEDDALVLTISGIKSDEQISADAHERALQLKIGACDILIRARRRFVTIDSERRVEVALDAEGEKSGETTESVFRAHARFPLLAPLYFEEMMNDDKALSYDKQEGILTVRISTKKNALPLSVHVMQKEESQESEDSQEQN